MVKIRLLVQGMTEDQVLDQVGKPAAQFDINCNPGFSSGLVPCKRWIYYYGDTKWVAEVTFISSRVHFIFKHQSDVPALGLDQYPKLEDSKRESSSSVEQPKTEQRPRGSIEFEKFRLLSLGMSEGEVISLAGEPAYKYALSCDLSITPGASCPKRWVYNYSDNWVAELTILGGRVLNINSFRHQ